MENKNKLMEIAKANPFMMMWKTNTWYKSVFSYPFQISIWSFSLILFILYMVPVSNEFVVQVYRDSLYIIPIMSVCILMALAVIHSMTLLLLDKKWLKMEQSDGDFPFIRFFTSIMNQALSACISIVLCLFTIIAHNMIFFNLFWIGCISALTYAFFFHAVFGFFNLIYNALKMHLYIATKDIN